MELLQRYKAGERWFPGTRLAGITLSGKDLSKKRDPPLDSRLPGAVFLAEQLGYLNLAGSDFSKAKLSRLDLSHAILHDVNFSRARLTDLVLIDVVGVKTNFSRARLVRNDIYDADLREANLYKANLHSTTISSSDLDGADWGSAVLDHTVLIDTDLSPIINASPPVLHEGPSTVDFSAVIRSIRCARLSDFLLRTGMPATFVEYTIECAMSVSGSIFTMLQSTFISYGKPDEIFASKLYEALHSNGVTTFFFPEHAEPGKKLHRQMREGINNFDRVILICSKGSLDRKGVLNEIEETLQRESRDGGTSYLIPIRLDDYIFNGWKPEDPGLAQAIRDRVVADFVGTDTDKAKFDRELLKLISALKKTPGPAPATPGSP